MVYAAPLGLLGLVQLIEDHGDNGPLLTGWALAYGALVALGPSFQAIGDCHTFFNGWRVGLRLRAVLTHEVCRKALRVDGARSQLAASSAAEVTNLLAVDANNVLNFSPSASWLWMEAAQLLLTLGLLFYLLGWAALGGLGVCLLCFPINLIVTRKTKALQHRLMGEKVRSRLNLFLFTCSYLFNCNKSCYRYFKKND